ncbi:MAG: hypothetical protein DDT33_00516 [Firmicutes bacterium]|nr:hypothetical protein [Bacillota bacterium]
MTTRPLSRKQQRFVDEYLIDFKAMPAARRAGYQDSTAAGLLSNPHITAAIEEAQKNHLKRLGLTQERVLEEYLKLAFSDMMNFINIRGDRITFKYNFDELPQNILAAISEISESPSTGIRIKLHDKLRALDSLAKHLGLFVNRVEVTGKDGGPIQYDLTKLSVEELSTLETLLGKSTSSG